VFFAFFTTFLFATSSVLAAKSQQAVGPARANLGRLCLGALFLGLWAHSVGHGLGGPALPWLLASGLVGMGVGDLAFFAALPFIGSRLTTTLNQCLAVPVAIAVEWLWLDARLTAGQLGSIVVILGGLVVALWPKRTEAAGRGVGWGIALGVVAATGQGLGAVLSRQAFAVAAGAGTTLDGLTAAYQRALGGLGLTLLWFGIMAWKRRERAPATPPSLRAHGWIVLHALAGPVFGMGTFQLALATTPSGIVLPITACAPLAVIPLAYWLEGERPSKRSLAGGAIAVAGAVTLALF
jgi:drug/metabolite transporter (DMT)-like permease